MVLDHDTVQFCTGLTNLIPDNTVLNAKTGSGNIAHNGNLRVTGSELPVHRLS